MVSGGCAKPPYTVFTGVIINAASRIGRYGVLDGEKRVQITVPTAHETKPSRFPPKTKSIITRAPRSMSSSPVESLKTIKKKGNGLRGERVLNGECETAMRIRRAPYPRPYIDVKNFFFAIHI